MLSLTPRLIWYSSAKDPIYFTHIRDVQDVSSSRHAGEVDREATNLNSIASEDTLNELFFDLDIGNYHNFFIPVFAYILFLLSVFNRSSRLSNLILFTFMFIIIIGLAVVTPVQPFLFKTVPFFKYFRNYFYFLNFLIPFITVFLGLQINQLIRTEKQLSKRQVGLRLLVTVIVHVFFVVYLYSDDKAPVTSLVTVYASFIAFLVYFVSLRKTDKGRAVFIILMFVLTLIQPLRILLISKEKCLSPEGHLWGPGAKPVFSYTRPDKEESFLDQGYITGMKQEMKDRSGFMGDFYFGLKQSKELHDHSKVDKIREYIRHKFILYDNVQYVKEYTKNLDRVIKSMGSFENKAFIFSDTHPQRGTESEDAPDAAEVINGDSDRFRVLSFGLNHIRFETDLGRKKFLVYNDSYHPDWKAWLNGDRVPVYRANYAFKGIWLPAGKNQIILMYKPWYGWVSVALLWYFLGFFFFTVYSFMKTNGVQPDDGPCLTTE